MTQRMYNCPMHFLPPQNAESNGQTDEKDIYFHGGERHVASRDFRGRREHDNETHQTKQDYEAEYWTKNSTSSDYDYTRTANGRTVDEWKIRPSHPDNHWLDCLVGCAVGASIQGVELGTLKTIQKPQRPRMKLSEFRKS